MEDKPATPPLDDVRFFQHIAADIRGRPQYYRDAGRWLDENYSDAAFKKMERAEWKERLRKGKAGQTPEAKAVIEGLSKLRPDKSGTMQPDEAFGLIVPYARQKLGMSEERFAELEAKARTGHLAPDADLRPLATEEKAKWPAMSGADRQELARRMALTTEQKKQRDSEREELHAVYTERDRLNGLVTGYYLGDGRLPYHEIQQMYRKRVVRKSFLMVRRFHEATLPFHKAPPAFPTVTESKRILLMTWLMTDPQAYESRLGLTEFENWPWDAAGQDPVHGRRYASKWWLFPSRDYGKWIAVARRAWEQVKAELASPGRAGPTERRWIMDDAKRDAEKLLEIRDKCMEWRDVVHPKGALSREAKAAERAVMRLIEANWALLICCRTPPGQDTSNSLARAFDWIDLHHNRGPELVNEAQPVALADCLTAEAVQPAEPTFIVWLGGWAQRFEELAASRQGTPPVPTPAQGENTEGKAQGGKKGKGGRPPESGDTDARADRKEANAWRKWASRQKGKGNPTPSFAQYASETGKDVKAVRRAVDRHRKRG